MLKAARLTTLFFLLSLLTLSGRACADTGAIAACHQFFVDVDHQAYGAAWKLLTARSQDTLIKAVADSEHMDSGKVRALFVNNDPAIQKGFWTSFRGSAKADLYVAATMKTLSDDGHQAKLGVYVNGQEAKAKLLAYKEGSTWKFGMAETFFPNGLK